MRKYWAIFKNSLLTYFEYRVNLLGTLLNELVGVSGVVILYWSVFSSNQSIAGYNLAQTLGYYLLIPLAGFFTSVYLSNEWAEKIRLGGLSSFLIKPYRIWVGAFMETISGKANYLLIVLPFWIAVVVWSGSVLQTPLIKIEGILPAIIICLAALIMHFFLDLVITLFAFWFDDIWSFDHFKRILFEFFGGVSFPLAFLPDSFQKIFNFLPFKYLYYLPVTYLNGKTPALNLANDLFNIFLWSCLFILLSVMLWKAGLKKYGAYGN